MVQLLGISELKCWDEIVQSFADYDVYYLSGYVMAFHIHGDGDPFLLYYESPELRAIYVFMKRKTAISQGWKTSPESWLTGLMQME